MSFNFGNTAPKTTGGGFSFPTLPTTTAGGTSGFSFGSALATSQPSGTSTFSFGTMSATPATSSTAATTTGGGLFSAAPVNQQQQQTAAPGAGFLAPPASSASSSFNFSAPAPPTTSTGFSSSFQLPTTIPASTATPTLQFGGTTKIAGAAPEAAKPAAPALQTFAFPTKPITGTVAPGASLFTPTTTTNATAAATSTSTSTTTASATFPILAAGQSSVPSTTSTTTTTSTSLGLVPAATTTAVATAVTIMTPASTTTAFTSLTTATTTSSATGAPVGGSSVAAGGLSVAGLEEKVNKWMSELKEQEERLMRQAAHVNAWDQLLQQGHDQVQQLRLTLNNVKTDQNRLQAELDFIQGQQQELEQLIEPLEAAAASTTPAQHQGDRQRENMHLVAQNLDSQLRQITDDLCKVIEHLNSSNSGSRATDPVNTVARVLSAHMDTLKWVDQNTALLSQKMDELSRASDNKRRD